MLTGPLSLNSLHWRTSAHCSGKSLAILISYMPPCGIQITCIIPFEGVSSFLDDSVLQGHSEVTGLSYSVDRKEGFLGIKVPRPSLGDREKSRVVD